MGRTTAVRQRRLLRTEYTKEQTYDWKRVQRNVTDETVAQAFSFHRTRVILFNFGTQSWLVSISRQLMHTL